jgi:hypothetical protein
MKKPITLLFMLLCLVYVLASCSRNLTDQSDIVSLYRKNEDAFLHAASNGDYSAVEKINGVQAVLVKEEYVEIKCGGAGFGSSTHYYGIFYSADDMDLAWMVEQGDGYLYQQEDGIIESM